MQKLVQINNITSTTTKKERSAHLLFANQLYRVRVLHETADHWEQL